MEVEVKQGVEHLAEVRWQWCRITELSVIQWHHLLSLRQAVFVVEQDCPYLDADELDVQAWHLIGWQQDSDRSDQREFAVAYLRVVDPGYKYQEPSIGRVLTRLSHRRRGLGKMLMAKVVRLLAEEFPQQSIRISAQEYLQRFYAAYGFTQVGPVYDEDGIPHIEMLASH